MRIFFADDSGNRRLNTHTPYFCLGGFSIDAAHLKQLARRLAALKRKWGLNPMPLDEVKFYNIGRDHHKNSKPNPLVREGYALEARITFGQELLMHLRATPSVKVYAVGIDRRHPRGARSPLEWAFMLLSERFEYSLNDEDPRVGLIIFDTEDQHDEMLRQALYSGSAWTNLPNIAETVMFVPSHHSPGIQFADAIAGAAGRWWNFRDDKYLQILEPVLGHDRDGGWRGSGLKAFPEADYPDL